MRPLHRCNNGSSSKDNEGYSEAKPVYKTTVGNLAALIRSSMTGATSICRALSDELELKPTAHTLASCRRTSSRTYKINIDARGSFWSFQDEDARVGVGQHHEAAITKGNHGITQKRKSLSLAAKGVITSGALTRPKSSNI